MVQFPSVWYLKEFYSFISWLQTRFNIFNINFFYIVLGQNNQIDWPLEMFHLFEKKKEW